MMIRIATIASTALLCTGCIFGSSDTADTRDPMWCGDVDGNGGDTGDVPNVLGLWSGTVGRNFFKETCGLGGLDEGSLAFLSGAIEIDGYAPDGLKLIPEGDRDNRLKGIESATGGLVFAGQRSSAWGEMHLAVGGLVYEDTYLERPVWQGMIYVGMDTDEDGNIDCDVQSDYKALKSGT